MKYLKHARRRGGNICDGCHFDVNKFCCPTSKNGYLRCLEKYGIDGILVPATPVFLKRACRQNELCELDKCYFYRGDHCANHFEDCGTHYYRRATPCEIAKYLRREATR